MLGEEIVITEVQPLNASTQKKCSKDIMLNTMPRLHFRIFCRRQVICNRSDQESKTKERFAYLAEMTTLATASSIARNIVGRVG